MLPRIGSFFPIIERGFLQNMQDRFLQLRIFHLHRRLPGYQNHIAMNRYMIRMIPDDFLDYSADAVSNDGIAHFFADRNTQSEMLNCSIGHIIYDKLTVAHRFAVSVYFIEIFCFGQSELFLQLPSPYAFFPDNLKKTTQCGLQGYALKIFLPFKRRAASTLRPFFVLILERKP